MQGSLFENTYGAGLLWFSAHIRIACFYEVSLTAAQEPRSLASYWHLLWQYGMYHRHAWFARPSNASSSRSSSVINTAAALLLSHRLKFPAPTANVLAILACDAEFRFWFCISSKSQEK